MVTQVRVRVYTYQRPQIIELTPAQWENIKQLREHILAARGIVDVLQARLRDPGEPVPEGALELGQNLVTFMGAATDCLQTYAETLEVIEEV